MGDKNNEQSGKRSPAAAISRAINLLSLYRPIDPNNTPFQSGMNASGLIENVDSFLSDERKLELPGEDVDTATKNSIDPELFQTLINRVNASSGNPENQPTQSLLQSSDMSPTSPSEESWKEIPNTEDEVSKETYGDDSENIMAHQIAQEIEAFGCSKYEISSEYDSLQIDPDDFVYNPTGSINMFGTINKLLVLARKLEVSIESFGFKDGSVFGYYNKRIICSDIRNFSKSAARMTVQVPKKLIEQEKISLISQTFNQPVASTSGLNKNYIMAGDSVSIQLYHVFGKRYQTVKFTLKETLNMDEFENDEDGIAKFLKKVKFYGRYVDTHDLSKSKFVAKKQ